MATPNAFPLNHSYDLTTWFNLEDMARFAGVHAATYQHVQRVIKTRDAQELLRDSHRFISTNNWQGALCTIIRNLRRPDSMLTFPVRYRYDPFSTLAMQIDTLGRIKIQVAYDWQISSESWTVIGHVTHPPNITCMHGLK